MTDLIDLLREHLAEPECTCPDCDVTSLADHEPRTVKGYSAACRVHGRYGTQPTYRPGEPCRHSPPNVPGFVFSTCTQRGDHDTEHIFHVVARVGQAPEPKKRWWRR